MKRPRFAGGGFVVALLGLWVATTLGMPTSTSAALSASIADLVFPAVSYSHDPQTSSGSLTLTATDTGTLLGSVNEGWNVTVESSSFVYGGPNAGPDIPADQLAITTAHPPTRASGQAVSPVGGPRTTGVTGALDVARKTMQADGPTGVPTPTYYGIGTYEQVIDVILAIPARARAGTYTATLTVTISAGP